MAENRGPRTGGRDFGGDREGGRGGMRPRRTRRKVCAFCADKVEVIDYKDVAKLLDATLQEEGQTDKDLTSLAETSANVSAQAA